MKKWDIFISHASEDKATVAKPLAEMLESIGLKVWLDSNELNIGDSLTNKINQGIANSKFGVIILSQSFFSKDWPIKELNSFLSTETIDNKRILPIWHKIDKEYIANYSPLLADKLSISTKIELLEIAYKLAKAVEAESIAEVYPELSKVQSSSTKEPITKMIKKEIISAEELLVEKKKKDIIKSIFANFFSFIIVSSIFFFVKMHFDKIVIKDESLTTAAILSWVFLVMYLFYNLFSRTLSFITLNINLKINNYTKIVNSNEFPMVYPTIFLILKNKMGIYLYYTLGLLNIIFLIAIAIGLVVAVLSLLFEEKNFLSLFFIIFLSALFTKILVFFLKLSEAKKYLL